MGVGQEKEKTFSDEEVPRSKSGAGEGEERRHSCSDANDSDAGSSSSSSSSSSTGGSGSSTGNVQNDKKKKQEKNRAEALLQAENRVQTQQRSRMWQTVASSGESDGNSGSSSEGSGNEDSEGDGRRVDMKGVEAMSKRKKVEEEKEGRSKRDEREGERVTKRRKREKKEKKRKHEERDRKRRRKEEKDDRKKEKRRKKDGKKEEKKKKKKKKERKDDKAKGAIIPGAVDMNQFGKHGIIRESDFHRKKNDFEVWCQEIKGLPEIPRNHHEALRLFRYYMEDYNTATFPHPKYYNVEAYEMDEYKRGQLKAAFKEGREGGVFKDEEERRLESKKGAKEGERADLEWALKMMSKEKRDALKEEELLRAKMQQAYKAGDLATVKRIERALMTEEEREKARYK
ncbi:hypothetical protein NSK_001341 [Nannochloropsis salina CCMP1776]|uniref:Uncharacterized protein n=1 Tax=Nannochloropsis salina CCMP1776 TaxID=1027361 RepID=A0A4D9D9E6_9STRA|nr:hypothetical protein NSK_001341 [Nannochloropsis salina CCMP1776]|eukprot:TFJ87007.1 hypothetical protein NSK_001341 [Nannochloropsis salina CCMP1776]